MPEKVGIFWGEVNGGRNTSFVAEKWSRKSHPAGVAVDGKAQLLKAPHPRVMVGRSSRTKHWENSQQCRKVDSKKFQGIPGVAFFWYKIHGLVFFGSKMDEIRHFDPKKTRSGTWNLSLFTDLFEEREDEKKSQAHITSKTMEKPG